jgi:bacillithiol synthase
MTPEVISRALSLPDVARNAMEGNADDRYVTRPRGRDAWLAHARAVNASAGPDWLDRLRAAIQPAGEAETRLARAASGNGFVVTTGQQPGLFGGPIYTLSKALSALALANALEKLTGLPVAPVFWAATDDTDFREASKVIVAMPGGARELVMEAVGGGGAPMSETPLGDVSALIAELGAASGSGADPNVNALVARMYSASATVGSAYVGLLRDLFAPLGIAVLDASHNAVREASLPILKSALKNGDEIAKAISANNAAIEKEGFQLQVQDVAGLSLVFETTATGRKRIPRKRGVRDLAPGADLGPNVLLRPIVERQILPTAAYVGGPAEIAYFAQLAPIADTLGVARPLIVPRWSCTIVEEHVRKILDRIGVEMDELQDPHAVETKVAREKLPEALQREISAFRDAVEERAASLARAADDPDPLVARAVVEGLRHNMAHRIDRFERRVVAAWKRRNAALMTDVATARGSLYPMGKPQERGLSFVPFLARYGKKLQQAMLEKAAEHAQTLL